MWFRHYENINYLRVTAVIVPLLIVGFIGSAIYFHYETVYPVQQIASKLGTSVSTADINHKVLIMKQVQVDLEGYSGNTAWPFPTLHTSFDDFKTQLTTTAIEAESLNTLVGVDDFAYQQGIISVNTAITEMSGRLYTIGGASAWNVYMNPITYIMMFATVASMPIIAIMDYYRVGALDPEKMKNRYG